MGEKILTVSIAAYNVEIFIRKALESLLDEETAPLLEVFVIDDGGTDRTLEIAKEFAARYPDTVKPVHKENGGYGSTVNYGMTHASGKYFKQLDGDDSFCRENLGEFLRFLQETDADLVLTPYYRVYEDGKLEDVDRHRIDGTTALSSLKAGELSNIHLHELAIRTELLRKKDVRLSEHRFYTDNEYVFFPCLYAETITRFPGIIYRYRMGDSVSLPGRKKHWTDAEDVILRMAEAFEDNKDRLSGAVRECLSDQLDFLVLFQMANYTVYPDKKAAYHRCREFSGKLSVFPWLTAEAGTRYPLVKRMLRAGYPEYLLLRFVYGRRVR